MGEFQLTDYIQYALALLFVLALIGILATLAKRTGFAGALPRHRSRDRRLSISEVLALDGKRRLILLRRDTTEHLVIIGPNSETVVETGISAPSENFASAALSVARQEPQLRGAKMLAPRRRDNRRQRPLPNQWADQYRGTQRLIRLLLHNAAQVSHPLTTGKLLHEPV